METPFHCDLDHCIFLVFLIYFSYFCFDYVLQSLAYFGSRGLASQWPSVQIEIKNLVSVQNQNKLRFHEIAIFFKVILGLSFDS